MAIRLSSAGRSRAIAFAALLTAATLALAAPVPAQAAAPDAATSTTTTSPLDGLDVETTSDDLPDPTKRGSYTPATIQETKLGLVDLQEPDSSGGEPTAGSAAAAEKLEIRGALYYPADRTVPSPVIILVHGNHGSCDAGQNSTTATCTQYKRNEAGYAYLAENLATWGYTTFSVSQDQLMMRQDNNKGKGMHQRRLLIAASLDALSAANEAGGLPVDEHTTIGTTLVGKLDMTRIGLMGHSRGGDAVTSFIDYNRTRTDGPRYAIRGVIALAPVDYERKAPTGVPFMTILPMCDGDVSNLQGARFFERSQYVDGSNPFPRIQVTQLGAIHNWYNTVWYVDGSADGQSNNDAACGNSAPFATTNIHPNNLRLSGAASYTDDSKNYKIDNSDTYNPLVNTKISGDPARMGDQEKLGLATMAAFLRRYVGGEGAFEPYMTGQLSDTSTHQQVPTSACPTSESGTRIACKEYVSTNYFAPSDERVDLIRPEVENPLTLNAQGGSLSGSGFAYPYLDNGGVTLPAKTAGGYDWCNPEPDDFAPSQLGKSTQPTAAKACPLPGKAELGGQNGIRENGPVNQSYGRQLALAWEEGQKAQLTAEIPAASKDVSGLKALSLSADVNFFDTRNPGADERGDNTRTGSGTTASPYAWPNEGPQSYDPTYSTQDFIIAVKDTAGHEATVHAGDERWGNALHMSTGTNTANTHIILDQIRVPLSEFTAQGVDISSLASVQLRFGEEGTPQSGSIELADVRFQEKAVDSPLILSDGTAPDQGAGYGPVTSGPDPAAYLAQTDNTKGNVKTKDTVADPYSNTTWVVDDDKAQCPNANFTSIQKAVDYASPWDTIVVCEGVYEESSTPVSGAGNPVGTGAMNGLTITKPLKIKGAGADKVTIMPDQSLDTLAGVKPYLRDGGGNVITVSRQSLGSTDSSEMFVDISGVTVTSGNTFAEAGIAYFGAAGRVSESVVGPLKTASSASELAENPYGWGIIKTGVIKGSGKGTVETELTVANSVVKGYQAGGILFDGGTGKDGAAANTVRSGIRQHGYVTGTVVTGKPNSLFAQTGIKYTSGFDGFVTTSKITGNYYKPEPAKSYGLLLTDALTETAGSLTATSDAITGNGYAVYNATADGTAVRTGAPFTITSSYLGTAAPVTTGLGDPDAGTEAVSGSSSVTVASRATSIPTTVATKVGATADAAPSAEIVNPDTALSVAVSSTVNPIVRASDDFAIESVELVVDGSSLGTQTKAPYSFTWKPTALQAGRSISLLAKVTDSSGQVTTTVRTVPVAAVVVTPPSDGGGTTTPPTTGGGTTKPTVKKPTLTLVKVTKNKKTGKATVVVKTSTAGKVALTGSKVLKRSKTVKAAKKISFSVKATAKQLKVLKKKGKLKVKVKVTFKAKTGTVTKTRSITLKKK